jgi:phosphohistidine phosphatase
MNLYILRHAIAVEREEWKGSDEARPLIDEGRERMKEIATGMLEIVPKLDLILSSPLVRAWQTAEIVAKVYGMKNSEKLRDTAALAPDSKFDSLFAELQDRADDKRVLVVGHQPHLGDLIAYLIADGFARSIPLKKGSLACLEIDPISPRSSCHFQWLLTPKQLRLIAGKK